MKGKLCVHDLASGRTDEPLAGSAGPVVLCIHLDAENNIWTGHRGGVLRVWAEAGSRDVCESTRIDPSDITCAAAAARCCRWASPT